MSDKKKVLLVEDNLEILEMLTTILENYFEIRSATNGREGLQMARQNPPDAAILDVNVPNVDGFSLCKILSEDPLTEHTQVIILTAAFTDEDSKKLAFAAGAVEFLTKPIKGRFLIQRLHEILKIPLPS